MSKKKILVVDDSKVASMTTCMILASRYECVTAENGAIGVEMASTEKPDLILMDVVMPTMDGFEACRKIRIRAETNGIPIIMVTTRGEPINVETGYECGCNDYVTKPIDKVELLEKIENLTGSGAELREV
jgi:DNA-binding response OmpR family regulator